MTSDQHDYDVFIIGGGINGVGIARDAVGRGFRTGLCEMNDLGSGTSSWSTKLIHGGVRYLEHYEFRLVREALIEREVLWATAPHIIWPMRFILPHHKDLRPAWLLRLGLFLYDHLGGRKALPATKTLNLQQTDYGKPILEDFRKGFEYSDCWVQDARLVVLCAMDAKDRGADIFSRTRCESAERTDGHWTITLQDQATGKQRKLTARSLINAGGPWVENIIQNTLRINSSAGIRMVQGSHIIVPKLYDHDRSYIFQNADNRIIFTIPYERDFTLIGTTDHDYEGDPADSKITDGEIDYLCDAASEYFRKPITRDMIHWTYAGVRPLYNDGASAAQEATREYVLKEDGNASTGYLVNIFGGKLTTHRKLAESVLQLIEGELGEKGRPWTHRAKLPGGEFTMTDLPAQIAAAQSRYSGLPEALIERYYTTYGTRIMSVLANANAIEQLGQHFGADVYEVEVRYLMTNEWARTAEDVLWRRTKRGLHMTKEQAASLDSWMQENAA